MGIHTFLENLHIELLSFGGTKMRGILMIPRAGLGFFFSAWITMIFWGIVGPDVGLQTISYVKAMVVTIALWLVMAPVITTISRRPRMSMGFRHFRT